MNYQDQGEQMGYGVYQYAAEVPYFPPSADYVGFNADDDGGKPDNIYEADEELHNNEAFQKNKMNVNLVSIPVSPKHLDVASQVRKATNNPVCCSSVSTYFARLLASCSC